MKYLIPILLLVALVAAFIGSVLRSSHTSRRLTLSAFSLGAQLFAAPPGFRTANAESLSGTHEQRVNKLADGAHTYRHLIVKAGSDADHIAVCGASDVPIGLSDDSPGAAEEAVNVILLGISTQTVRMTCATALATEIDVYAGANGFVVALPGSAGTYYKVGRSRAAASIVSAGVYTIEVEPCAPQKTVVIAAATGTAATDVAALFTALQGGPAFVKAL